MVKIVSTKFSKLLFAATCPRVLSIRQHLLSGCESVSSTRSLSLTSFQSGCSTLRLPAELPRSKVIRHQEAVWPLVFAAFAFHSIFRTLSIGSILTSLPFQSPSQDQVCESSMVRRTKVCFLVQSVHIHHSSRNIVFLLPCGNLVSLEFLLSSS